MQSGEGSGATDASKATTKPSAAPVSTDDHEDSVSLLDGARKEFRSRRFWILFGPAAGCLLISIVLSQCSEMAVMEASEPPTALDFLSDWQLFSVHSLAEFLRELGVAGVIALVILLFVERAARDEQKKAFNDYIRKTGVNIFEAIFGNFVPPKLAQLALDTVFFYPVIRHQLRVAMEVAPLPAEYLATYGSKFVILKVSTSYELDNISSRRHDHRVRVTFPLPWERNLIDLAKLINLSVDSRMLSEDERKKCEVSDTDYEKRYQHTVSLDPGKRQRIFASYQLVKEVSDNEYWSSLLSTIEFEVTVTMRVPNIEWNLEARCASLAPENAPVDGPRGEGTVNFMGGNALLPFQGILLWWRPKVPGANHIPDARSTTCE